MRLKLSSPFQQVKVLLLWVEAPDLRPRELPNSTGELHLHLVPRQSHLCFAYDRFTVVLRDQTVEKVRSVVWYQLLLARDDLQLHLLHPLLRERMICGPGWSEYRKTFVFTLAL